MATAAGIVTNTIMPRLLPQTFFLVLLLLYILFYKLPKKYKLTLLSADITKFEKNMPKL